MTKRDLVRQIAIDMDADQAFVREIVQRCLDNIVDIVADKGRLELRNFGVFQVKRRAARKARNPRTNQEVYVPAKQVLTFQAGKKVMERIQATTLTSK